MSAEYQIGDTVYRVAVNPSADDLCTVRITRAGEADETQEPVTLTAELRPVEQYTYVLVVDGQQHLVRIAAGPEMHYVSIGGQTFAVVPPEQIERQRRRGTTVDAHSHVTPPMPGQVIKIAVAVGDEVEAGQTVVVISAMKMESNLTAPYAGTVTAINTSVGAQVNPGDVLVDIEARDG